MKIGKKAIVVEIENPLRPRTGLQKKRTICRVTENTIFNSNIDFEYSVQVDADDVPEFKEYIKSLPKNSYYRNNVLEMWFVKEEHLKDLLEKARSSFDVVHHVRNKA